MSENNQEINTNNLANSGAPLKKTLPAAVLLFFVLTFMLALYLVKKPSMEKIESIPQATTPENKKSNPSSSSTSYKDGTYTSEGLYTSPIGEKRIKVVIDLKSNVVTDVIVGNEADDPTSVKFQDLFISGYKELVVGKNINELKLSKVSGSSLTPIGFNNAIEKIKEQAKI